MTIKGYVVRGQDRQLRGADVWATADGVGMKRERAKLYDVAAAVGAWAELRRCSWCADARILAVAEDGTETPLPSYEDALAEIERLRACPLAALVRTFRGDPADPDARGPVWAAFDRVVAAVPEDRCDEVLVDAIEDLRFALDVRLRQMREALDDRDAMLAEGPAPCS